MSFDEQIYRPFFNTVSIFGLLPFHRNPKNRSPYNRSIAKCIYSVFLILLLDSIFVFGVSFEIIRKFKTKKQNGTTLFFVSTFQEFFVVFMYGCVMINSVVIAKKHASFLNTLMDLDVEVQQYLKGHKCKSSDVRHPQIDSNWITVILVLWTIIFISILEITIGPDKYKFISVLFVWMSTTHLCNGLYIRLLATLINRSFRSLRVCFSQNNISLLDDGVEILDKVHKTKEMFVDVFSGCLIINLFYDLMTMLIVVFWAIYTVVYIPTRQTKLDAVWIVSGYFVPFLVKMYLVTNAAEGFTAEVSLNSGLCFLIFYCRVVDTAADKCKELRNSVNNQRKRWEKCYKEVNKS